MITKPNRIHQRLVMELSFRIRDYVRSKCGNCGVEGAPDMQKMRHTRRVAKLTEYANPKDACFACYGSLIYSLDRLDDKGLLRDKKAVSLAIGQGYRGKDEKIGIGQCTKCFEKTPWECPPKAVDIAKFLREEWD